MEWLITSSGVFIAISAGFAPMIPIAIITRPPRMENATEVCTAQCTLSAFPAP